MAFMEEGSKPDSIQRGGQAWFCTTGLPTDVTVEVEEMSFHLHKFPLISKSGRFAKLVADLPNNDKEGCRFSLLDIPGGPEAFELAAKFCYGVKIEFTATNVAPLRCAAEYLEMTEEFGEGNLIARTENFLNQVVIRSWKESIQTLQSCETLLPQAEELNIVKKCVDSIAMKACTDPSLFGWPMEQGSMQSPGGSIMWNGISTGAKPRNSRADWWYEDISILSLALYKRVIAAMEAKGLCNEKIAGALMHYAKKQLPGLNRRHGGQENIFRATISSLSTAPSEVEQRVLLEAIDGLLPSQKGVSSTHFLFGLLRISLILNASSACKSNLEKRIGMQLEQATLDDLLIPNYSYTVETLYDIDCIQRILDHFLLYDQTHETPATPQSFEGPFVGSPSVSPLLTVAKLIDDYLAEVAPDINLKPAKFQSLAEMLPDYSRVLDDSLYRAIDIYLKAHSWLTEKEREHLSGIMDCQKLSLEACTHAAQNERLPLRVVVQVLFFEQLQLRTAIAGSFLANEDPARQSRFNLGGGLATSVMGGEGWGGTIRENHALKMDMDTIKLKVTDLEKECSTMRQEIQKIRKSTGWSASLNEVSKRLGCKFKPEICASNKMAVSGSPDSAGIGLEQQRHLPKGRKHRRGFSLV
eukprot:c29080_g1_i1 orf=671-2590(-)